MSEHPASLRYLDPVVASRLDNMEMRARMIVEGFITGLHKSPYHGFSVEFAEHRPYNPGDELRHIDWKAYAKTDRHYVKQYEEETNLRSYIVLDTSDSMRYKGQGAISKFEYGAYLAGALHYLMVKQRDATGLIAFDDSIHTIMPPKSTNSFLRQLLLKLEALTTRPADPKKTGAATALDSVADRITRRSLVMIITDLFENVSKHDDLLKSLRHLRYRGHEVLVFHVLESQTEREFSFPDLPSVFRDMETGQEVTLHPAQLRENYREAVRAFSERFRVRCREYKIDFVEVDSAGSFDAALLAYLNKRKTLA